MDVAVPLPEIHGASRLLGDPRSEILVGNKEEGSIRRSCLHDFHRVAACADHISQCLHTRTAVDVGDDVIVLCRVIGEERLKFFSRTGIGQGTPRVHVGNDDGLRGVQDLCGLTHEVNTAEDNDVGIRLGGLNAQAKRVSHEVGHVLDLLNLVVMGEDDCIPLAFESQNLSRQIGGMGVAHRDEWNRRDSSGLGSRFLSNSWVRK